MEINVHLYLHIHVKIQCWFSLDQCVWADSQIQFVFQHANGPPFHIPGTAPHFTLRWLKEVLFPSAQQVILACSFVQIVCQTLMIKPKHLRLESLVPSKEDLAVYPQLLLGTANCWEGLPGITEHMPPSAGCWHTSCGYRRMLTHPQKSESHLNSCPKIHAYHFHTQSCLVKVYPALTGYRDLTVIWYIV